MRTRAAITVCAERGKPLIDAICENGLALHPDIEGDGWHVTMISQGQRITLLGTTRQQARRIFRRLLQVGPWDLQSVRSNVQQYHHWTNRVLDEEYP